MREKIQKKDESLRTVLLLRYALSCLRSDKRSTYLLKDEGDVSVVEVEVTAALQQHHAARSDAPQTLTEAPAVEGEQLHGHGEGSAAHREHGAAVTANMVVTFQGAVRKHITSNV